MEGFCLGIALPGLHAHVAIMVACCIQHLAVSMDYICNFLSSHTESEQANSMKQVRVCVPSAPTPERAAGKRQEK